ncbi:hypothetical protein CRG98_014040, partial [Punica granatum]
METGLDVDEANTKARELAGRVTERVMVDEAELTRFRTELLPAFLQWNRWERWKDVKNWDPKRVGALIMYMFVVAFSCQRMYVAVRAPFQDRQRKELTEAYMEALIPEPSPSNIRKFKKGVWRKSTPKGLKLKKFIEGPDGTLIHDPSYVGEDAWDDSGESLRRDLKQIIDSDVTLKEEQKSKVRGELAIREEVKEKGDTWRERLSTWKEVLKNEQLNEQLDSLKAKYVVEFDMKEVENSLRKDVKEKVANSQGVRAQWIAKRWWRYRPKLPYTYFLQKLDSSEVAAIVFTEDLKRLYVTMKEGFPLEYI